MEHVHSHDVAPCGMKHQACHDEIGSWKTDSVSCLAPGNLGSAERRTAAKSRRRTPCHFQAPKVKAETGESVLRSRYPLLPPVSGTTATSLCRRKISATCGIRYGLGCQWSPNHLGPLWIHQMELVFQPCSSVARGRRPLRIRCTCSHVFKMSHLDREHFS